MILLRKFLVLKVCFVMLITCYQKYQTLALLALDNFLYVTLIPKQLPQINEVGVARSGKIFYVFSIHYYMFII